MTSIKIISAIMLASMLAFAENPTYDWNDRITKSAFGSSEVLKTEMKRLDSPKQALFARDIVRSISLFPNPRTRLIDRMSNAILDLIDASNLDVKPFVKMMAIDAIPIDMKSDVLHIMEEKCNNRVKHILPNANGGIEYMMSELQTISTNKVFWVDRTTTDNMQSDIGVLRVPRYELRMKRRRKNHANPSFNPAEWVEPQPYRLQKL